MRKIESNPFGLFPHSHERPLEENLFHLLGLYDILLKEAFKFVPDERKAEFEQHHKLIDKQRRAYREHAEKKQ